MKLNESTNTVVIDGDFPTTQFGIEASNAAFDILSSALYSDKELAVIRELSCNAYDSHKLAGKLDTPFDVHIPTYVEPYFYIEDYGVGLSENQIFKIYTRYFSTTKSDSNDFIGGLGLGSKSPFCKAESFLVISTHNGIRTTYTAYKDDSGIPSISKLVSESVGPDVSNGVKIQMDVPNIEFDTWATKCAKYYITFNPRPRILGRSINIPKDVVPETDFVGEKWFLFKTDRYSGNADHVLMGNVRYNLNLNSINHSIPKLVKEITNSGYSIRFNLDIGDVDISASREELAYKKRTNELIHSLLLEIEQILNNRVESIISSVSDQWSYWKMISMYRNSYVGSIEHLLMRSKINHGISKKINGKDLTNNPPYFTISGFGLPGIENQILIRKINGYGRSSRYLKNIEIAMPLHDNPVVIVDTTTSRNEVIESLTTKEVVVIKLPSTVKGPARDATVQSIEDYFKVRYPGINVTRYSNIPIPAKTVNSTVTVTAKTPTIKSGNVFLLKSYGSDINRDNWVPTNKTWKDSGYFVKISNHQIVDNNGNLLGYKPHHLIDVISSLKSMKLIPDDFEIHGVRSSIWKTVDNESRWINAIDYLTDIIDEKIISVKDTLKIDDASEYHGNSYLRRKLEYFDLDNKYKTIDYGTMNPNSQFKKIRDMALEVRKIAEATTDLSTWKKLANSLRLCGFAIGELNIIDKSKYNNLVDELNKFCNKSELIRSMVGSWSSPTKSTIEEIILISDYRDNQNKPTNP